ncbi:hypothetical protein GA0070624_4193 [Micromonospora rhizosphaerae]|uniref:Uncharacterized protein n=2 Tax=Micromonospora rhizosphaerae TaxID=568872 RepID=A0A1C6SN76_9ACTN|nr:hypothetical protein GA0070624_4193 [Micromonospora rhizosphaerae]
MRWPDLWLELLGADRTQLTTIGLIYPRWLRGETGSDLELQDPTAIVQWLTRWAPDAAAALTRRVPPSDRS